MRWSLVAPRFLTLLVCLLAAGSFGLLAAEPAQAGYGAYPNGQSFPVAVNSIGYVATPASIDLVVVVDRQDSSAYVWVSESPEIGLYGLPAGSISRPG